VRLSHIVSISRLFNTGHKLCSMTGLGNWDFLFGLHSVVALASVHCPHDVIYSQGSCVIIIRMCGLLTFAPK
jgi:hypothetical protein